MVLVLYICDGFFFSGEWSIVEAVSVCLLNYTIQKVRVSLRLKLHLVRT